MTDRIYFRPDISLEVLLDALHEAGADRGLVGTGDSSVIAISISDASDLEIDDIWNRALGRLGFEKPPALQEMRAPVSGGSSV